MRPNILGDGSCRVHGLYAWTSSVSQYGEAVHHSRTFDSLRAHMSLADELMNDLDGLSDDEQAPEQTSETSGLNTKNGDMGPPSLPNGKRKAEGNAEDDEDDDEFDKALEGLGGDDDAKDGEDGNEGAATMADGSSAAGYIGAGGTRPADELDREEVEGMDLKDVDDVESVVKLHKSRKLLDALQVSETSKISAYTLIS